MHTKLRTITRTTPDRIKTYDMKLEIEKKRKLQDAVFSDESKQRHHIIHICVTVKKKKRIKKK